MNNLLLLGIKHSGKSSIGKDISKKLNKDFYDLDDIIIELYNKENKTIKNCRELYTKKGKNEFQKYEYLATKKILELENTIVATGGGFCNNKKAIELLDNKFLKIYLFDKKRILYKRVKKSGIPPFLDKKNPKKSFFKLFKERNKIYNKISDIKVKKYRNKSIQDNSNKIIKEVKNEW